MLRLGQEYFIVRLAYVRARGLIRAGASRKLAACITESAPDVLAVCEIEPGDAFSLATRFAMQWAYRGGQALFWNARFAQSDVHDTYLPVSALPIDRRGFLRVDGVLEGDRCSLVTTQIDEVRERRILGLRFLRTQLRACESRVLLFAQLPKSSAGIRDLGLVDLIDESALHICSRGFDRSVLCASTTRV